jgi:hypothetical protein
VQMYDMLSAFRGRIVDLERLVLNGSLVHHLCACIRALTPIGLHVHVWSPQRRQPKAHLQEGDKCPPSTLPLASLNQTYALRCQAGWDCGLKCVVRCRRGVR